MYESADRNYCCKIRYAFMRYRLSSTKTRVWCCACVYEAASIERRSYTRCPNCGDRLSSTDYRYEKYLSDNCRMTRDVRSARREEALLAGGSLWLFITRKGSIFCRACTRRDNDRAGDIVRTCRDYVIGLASENVAAMIIHRIRLPVDQHRDTCGRYRLSLPSSRFLPP